MAHSANKRTSLWVKSSKPHHLPEDFKYSVDEMDAPLDFSKKKLPQPEDDNGSEGASSRASSATRTADSPPVSMVAYNSPTNLMTRPLAGGKFPSPHNLPGFQFPSLIMDNKSSKSAKPVRPFKAYPRDALSLPLGFYGLQGLQNGVLDSLTPQMFGGSEDLYLQYKRNAEAFLSGTHGSNTKKAAFVSSATSLPNPSRRNRKSAPDLAALITNGVVSSSVRSSKVESSKSPPSNGSGSPVAPSGIMADSATGAATPVDQYEHDEQGRSESKTPEPGMEDEGGSKKRPRSVPDEIKDESYWERRRKNNEAAKRSRDARRAKEDEIALRAAYLEQENLKLRVEVAALRSETTKLRNMLLYNN